MASTNEQILVRIDFQADDAYREIQRLEQGLSDLTKKKKELQTKQKQGIELTEEEAREYAQLEVAIKDARGEKNKLVSTAAKLERAQKQGSKTIAEMRARLKQLNLAIENHDRSTEAARKELEKLKQEHQKVKTEIVKHDESLNRHHHNVGNYEGAIKGARQALTAMVAGVAIAIQTFQQINQLMDESIRKFGEQEKAERQLEFAAGGAAEALKEQARQIQANSTFGDEAIIGQQAYLASLGFTEQQIKDMIQASVDLSAATGMSLDGAVRNLAKTYSGLTGELGESLPMLRGLTQEQLKAGAATEAIRQQFAGTAKEISETGIGALEKMENAYGDLQERLGEKLLPIQLKMTEAKLKFFELVIKFADENKVYLDALGNIASLLVDLKDRYNEAAESAQGLRAQIAGYVEEQAPFLDGLAETDEKVQKVEKGFSALTNPIEFVKASLKLYKQVMEAANAEQLTFSELLVKQQNELKQTGEVTVSEARRQIQLAETRIKAIQSEIKAQIALRKTLEDNFGLTSELQSGADALLADLNTNLKGFQDIRSEFARAANISASEIKNETESIEDNSTVTESNTEEKKKAIDETVKLKKAVLDVDEALRILDGNALRSDSVIEPEVVSQADLAAQKLDQIAERAGKANAALSKISEAFDIIGQGIDTKFQNQIAGIERATLAEKEAIEASTMSEEQKRIAIERAEQKKATAIEKIERKQAKAAKAQAVIKSIINTALGITAALTNPLTAPFIIPFIAATGAAQTAIIAAQQFADGGQVADLGSGEGGAIPVAAQNIPALGNGDNVLATVKTGEVILNESQQARLKALTGSANVFRAIGVPGFADGGLVPSFSNTNRSTASRIEQSNAQAIGAMQSIKVVNVATETAGMATMVNNIETEATFG